MIGEINRQMLVLARESRGLTQQELADALWVTQGYVAKIEGGSLNVSEDFLDKLSEKLAYPKEFFFQVEDVRGVGSACNYHRKRQALTGKDWHKITAKLNLLRIHSASLLRGVDTVHENHFHFLDNDDFDSPEQVARLIRRYWNIAPGPIGNLIEAIENAGGIVYLFPFGTDKLDAISQTAPGQPPLFLVNSEISADRCRFTLAHELGHIVMHGRSPSENMESEADRFAAEFLMPARDIIDDLKSISITKAASLKPYWKVAIAALIRRAKDLGTINAQKYTSLYKQLSYHGYRKREPVEIPSERPTVLRDVVQVYLSDYGFDLAALGKLLRLFESDVQEYLSVLNIGQQTHLRVVTG